MGSPSADCREDTQNDRLLATSESTLRGVAGLLGLFARAANGGDIAVFVERRRPPECMCCGEKAATIMRRSHVQLIGHPFEQIGETLLRLRSHVFITEGMMV